MYKKIALILLLASMFSSCASQIHRGVVAMKIDEDTAHVGLGKGEVYLGDHVELYGNKCNKVTKVQNDERCVKVLKGHGTVTEIINENYVSVKFDSGVGFQEGDFIEKHSH